MAACAICQRNLSIIEWVMTLQTNRCKQCEQQLRQAQGYWQDVIEQAFNRNGVSKELEQQVYQDFNRLKMPPDLGNALLQRLQYLRQLSEIRWGNVPIIRTDVHLDSDEYAHFALPVTYLKPNKQVRMIEGQLIGTNKKMYFISNTGRDSMKVDWNNVMKAIAHPHHPQMQSQVIELQVAKGSGGGSYLVADSLYLKTIVDTLVRMWKRQLVIYKETASHGEVPEHVKNAAFLRDGGKCVQCGYEGPYIEYDHRIPRSKGGPNTVENIQLLCRMCNLKKGARI